MSQANSPKRAATRMVGWWLLVLLQGCASLTMDKAKSDIAAGKLRDAERHLLLLSNGSSDYAQEARMLLASVQKERQQASAMLHELAKQEVELLRRGEGTYADALALLDAALSQMSSEEPQAKALLGKRHEMMQAREQAERKYKNRYRALKQAIERCTPDGHVDEFRALAALGRQTNITGHTTLLVRAAYVCFLAGEPTTASRLAHLSMSLRHPGEPLTDRQATTLALARLRGGYPSTASSAKASAKSRYRRSRATKKGVSDKPELAPGEAQEVSEMIARVQGLFDAERRFEALTQLDHFIETASLSPQSLARLTALQRKWDDARGRLLEELLMTGERALREEQPDLAYDAYRRMLLLSPDHSVALDRMRKLEALRALQAEK